MKIISETQYNNIQAALVKWRDSGFDDRYDVVTEEDVDAMEVYEFVTNPTDTLIAIVNSRQTKATTLYGTSLGSLSLDIGRAYRSNFGDVRIPCSLDGINGRAYRGTFYMSAGYARMRLLDDVGSTARKSIDNRDASRDSDTQGKTRAA
jgi:hypothetical protein